MRCCLNVFCRQPSFTGLDSYIVRRGCRWEGPKDIVKSWPAHVYFQCCVVFRSRVLRVSLRMSLSCFFCRASETLFQQDTRIGVPETSDFSEPFWVNKW